MYCWCCEVHRSVITAQFSTAAICLSMAALVEQLLCWYYTVFVKYVCVVWQPESQLSYLQQTLKCVHDVTNKWPTADGWRWFTRLTLRGCNPWLIKSAAASTSSLCFTHSLANRIDLASVPPSVSTPMRDSAEDRISG